MIGTYLLTISGCTAVVIVTFLGAAHYVAEWHWNKHPLARVSQRRAASFSSRR
ncbi:hypothetical protein [Herbaspirillum sp. YR522]|uniref:hypothetical protein n=1 Tax=Herbaspirillum sp. YR522 TaxID=1144342 RepID=UPI00026F5CBB|nr:hypothetical protein [Herbaspirillum sp. YR522]EJN01744.1 hypothetical protein PMI40_03231 [Herbaspirillum sp. YR522]